MKSYNELKSILEAIPGIGIKKSYYRLMGIKYLKNPLSALGSKLSGGRYNHIGQFEALYLAPDPKTAVEENLKNISFRFPPKSIITIDVDVQSIIDLKSKKLLNILGINRDQLFCPWRKIQDIDQKIAYTQVLGQMIYDSERFEGILYPSAKVKGKYNLAIFPDRLKKGSSIKVYDPDKILEQVIKGQSDE
jgi:RES domain-containing protein